MPFLIGGHRYLFKHAAQNYPTQFWCEVIAYRIGCLMGIPVPPAYAAWRAGDQKSAALIEWFYRQDEGVCYESGTVHMQRLIPDFDVKKGRQHNIETVLAILAEMDARLIQDMVRILVFDALIGNTDRHQENWGILWRGTPVRPELAPAFDNGTSLGYEMTDDGIAQFMANPVEQTERYIDRGRHHMRWNPTGAKYGHFELVAYLLAKYPEFRQNIADCLSFDRNVLYAWMHLLPRFPVPAAPTPVRIQWIERLLQLRMKRLHSVLDM
ncbi:MAG: HipA domain-containing protein [Magnetococcales bacterium]|nr:HipA domain-containing protein [Magnetococcales bacterium]